MMMKALLAPVLATGLALGGAAKPADALTAEETAALLAGIAIIGVIASNHNNNSRNTRVVTQPTPRQTIAPVTRNVRHGNVLPAQCVRRFDTNRGVRNLAIENCLQRNGVRTARLPDRCEVRVRTNRGTRDAFRQRCLENAGFRFRDTAARQDRHHDGRVILDARRSRN